MKILHIGKFFAPIEGGIESINKFVVDSLKGNEQIVISFNDKNENEIDEIDGTKVYRMAVNKTIARQPISFTYYTELKKLFKEFNPDIVHFHHPNPLVSMYLLELIPDHTKLILHWHSDVVAQKALHRFIKPFENSLLRRADVIISTSPNYKENSLALKNYQNKINIIPCSIDESKFDLSEEEKNKVEELKLKYDNKPIILFLGRHVEYKGIEFLLQAEEHIKNDCVILIAGQGPLTSQLKSHYNSDRIKWLGKIPDDEMKLFYHAASVLAFPSITKNEAFGVVLAEAMYCSTPAVTFTIPGSGVNWVCPNQECGLEVENQNYIEYAKAIDSLLSHQDLREKLSVNAHQRASNLFSKDVVSKQYIKLYEGLNDLKTTK